MNTTKVTTLLLCLASSAMPSTYGIEKKEAATQITKKAKWVDPCKGKIYSKINYVQIPLTANEQHLLGSVKTVSYRDYKISPISGEAKMLDDSGYNMYDNAGHLVEQNEYNEKGEQKWKCLYGYDKQNKATTWDLNFPYRNERETVTFKYDERGNKIEENTYDQNKKLTRKTINKYDEKGNQTDVEIYNGTGKLMMKDAYKYDNNNNQVELASGLADGYGGSKTTCEYDNNGNKIGGTDLRFKEKKATTWTRKNDELGRCVELKNFSANGYLESKEIRKYDEWDNLIEYNHYKPDDQPDESFCHYYKNEYDAHGNIIKQTAYKLQDGKRVAEYYTETTYTYY